MKYDNIMLFGLQEDIQKIGKDGGKMLKQKGFKDYLNDDPSLVEKFTYEEFYGQKNASPVNEDVTIEEAFNVCMRTCNKLEKTV